MMIPFRFTRTGPRIRLWLVFAAIQVCMLGALGVPGVPGAPGISTVFANGGNLVIVKRLNGYEIDVSTLGVLQVGNNDVSVLIGREDTGEIVHDAKVSIVAERVDARSAPVSAEATRAKATDPNYYAALMNFPTEGTWKLTVHVQTTGAPFSIADTVTVFPAYPLQSSGPPIVAGAILLGVLVAAFIVRGRRRTASSSES